MKLLSEYTWDYVKRNRRSSIAIMVAILMSSMMLSALCGYLYNIYTDNLRYILRENGDWHGELFGGLKGDKLPVVEAFDSVEAIMIKGDWKAAKIEDPRRDYLIWRDANAGYWESMPEGDIAITEGRAPSKAGEIALSKQYFEHHPELAMGDTIQLPKGNRTASDGRVLSPVEQVQEGEQFVQETVTSLKVVGKLDVTTSSSVPGYTGIGFLESRHITEMDDITVYIRFKNIRDTYKELPQIAKAVGYEKDEYGEYLLRYNTEYLSRKVVLSPKQMSMLNVLLASQMPLMFGVIGLLVVGLFVLVIHNAFAMSARARLAQLGILASIGATPKQIKRSVVQEALLLSVIPLPLGILLGQLPVKGLLVFINRNTQTTEGIKSIVYSVGWQSILPAVCLTLLTVWWSAVIPARRAARIPPIEAIRMGGEESLKKPRHSHWSKRLGIIGELAGNAMRARKKSYRTGTLSLILSFFTLVSMLCINSASTASKAVYQTDAKRWENQDILVRLDYVAAQEDYEEITRQAGGQKHVAKAQWYNALRAAAWLKPEAFSDEFREAGAFEVAKKEAPGAFIPMERDGKRRLDVIILGMDDESFLEYCKQLGINSDIFYESGRVCSILYNSVEDLTKSTKRNPVSIPYLDIRQGDRLTLSEKTRDDYEGDYAFEMEIAFIADQMPDIGENAKTARYDLLQIMPMSRVNELAEPFARNPTTKINGVLCTDDPKQIVPVRKETEQICESYFGSGDYSVTDEVEYYENQESALQMVTILFGFVAGLLAVIGLSNVWSTVLGTLSARRREFSMLRSAGLPPKGVYQMPLLEGCLLGLNPILLSIPFLAALQAVFLWINEVSFIEWLPYFPWAPVLLYIAAVLIVTAAAYMTGGRRLMRENIIEGIRMDML